MPTSLLRPRSLLASLLAVAAMTALVAPAACSGADSSSSSEVAAGSDAGGAPPDGGSLPRVDGAAPIPTADGAAPAGGIKTVFLILMENHSWKTIKASPSATYITGTLLPAGAHAEAYSTPAGNHPSEPNYIWLEAGDNLGITNDSAPSSNHQATKDHLTTQLEAKGITWKAYAEGITGTKCPLTASGSSYDPKHTPQLFFDDVTDGNSGTSKRCIDHVRPFSELAADLSANKVARYNFITPDLCHDMHGETSLSCPLIGTDLIKRGDDWLAAQVPAILASAAYKDNGALFLLWDEGDEALGQEASDGPIGMIVLSPLAKAGFASSTAFTHSSLFKTLQTVFGVPLLRGALASNDLGELFTTFP